MAYYIFFCFRDRFFQCHKLPWTVNVKFFYAVYIIMLSSSLFDGIYLTLEYSTFLLPFTKYIPYYYSLVFSSIIII